MLVLYSSVAFTWLLCIWYLWRTILTSGLWGIGLTAGVSSCCDVENFVHLYSRYIHIYIYIYNRVYKSISMELDFVKNAFGETIS